MPTFATPEPITATLEFDIGMVRITASKRTDTLVEVRPVNDRDELDVRTAKETTVTCTDGRLLVKGPRKRSPFGKSGSVDIVVELPAGSDLHGTTPLADFTCTGPLGDCRLRTSVGTLRIDSAATLDAHTDHGAIHADHIVGDAEVSAAGRIEIGTVGGTATLRNANGDTTIREVAGRLQVGSANGRITVGIAHSDVDAKCAHGTIRLDEVARGRVDLQSGSGDLEVGIRESTAAWLDVRTQMGSVRNSLDAAQGPDATEQTVEVRARTSMGHIVIRRA
ncbi:DUF4097 family beta strand repeat-containing protein [Embleya sp. MST-111070]|uniref:DUF4097 family beta strand repeat-containing protein n=1 Tax=Embleya sp. MST-111070 TaxID=3398231 RepID=UPI003F73D254